jgi:hypothetical protein
MRLNSTGLAMRLPEVKGRGPKKLLGPEASKAVKALLACDQTRRHLEPKEWMRFESSTILGDFASEVALGQTPLGPEELSYPPNDGASASLCAFNLRQR